jgi:hypothetical protein
VEVKPVVRSKSRRGLRKPAPGAEANQAMLVALEQRDIETRKGVAVVSRRERLLQRNALREGGGSVGDGESASVAGDSSGVIIVCGDGDNSDDTSQQQPDSPICSDCEDVLQADDVGVIDENSDLDRKSDVDEMVEILRPYEIRDQRRTLKSLGHEIKYLICWADAEGAPIEIPGEITWELASTFDDDPDYFALIDDWKSRRPKKFNAPCWNK